MPCDLAATCANRDLSTAERLAQLRAILQTGADVNEAEKNGVTPLHFAVRFRHPEAVEMLLRSGADVNRRCKRSGSTPLHRAVTSTGAPGTSGKSIEAREIARILLRHGADPSIKNASGKLPADYADAKMRSLLDGQA